MTTGLRYILERYYDADVAGMHVVCVHPDVGDVAFVDDVPDLTELVGTLMAEQRERHADARYSESVAMRCNCAIVTVSRGESAHCVFRCRHAKCFRVCAARKCRVAHSVTAP